MRAERATERVGVTRIAGGALRPGVALLLVTAHVVLLCSGCVSVRTTGHTRIDGVGCGVAVQVFADDAARRAGRSGPTGILSELDERKSGRWVTVFRSLNPVWTVAGLKPGEYRLRFPAHLDDAGNVVAMANDARRIKVAAGEVTQVQAVLDHVPVALIVAGVVVVVVAAVLLADYLKDHDLPMPPLPPPDVAEAIFYISLDLADAAAWQGVSDRLAPVVTSHFPASGALVAARRPRIIFSFTEPLRARDIASDGIAVMSEKAGLIAGTLAYDAERWWVTWTPKVDLPPADTFHVTLRAGAVEDGSGNENAKPASFSFTTAK